MFVIQVIENVREFREDVLSNLFDEEVRIENSKDLTFVRKTRNGLVRGLYGSLMYKTKSGAEKFILKIRKDIESSQAKDQIDRNRFYRRHKFYSFVDANQKLKHMVVRTVDVNDWNNTVDRLVEKINDKRRRYNVYFDKKVAKTLKLKELV